MPDDGVASAPSMTTQHLCRALLKSDLVDEETLKRSLASIRVKHDGELPDDARTVADDLVASGLITKWQSTHLLQGRWRGFFLGKYKLIKLLGAGGMGSVYLGEHTVMNKRLAIKVLPKEGPKKESSLKSFQAEARTAAMLDHANIVRTVDIDEVKGRHFIVMEFIDGSDLDRRVRKRGPLSIAEALGFFRQATLGLQYAHERGVLHRDVKPLNMLITRDGVLKVSDLGLARLRHEHVEDASKKRIVGTADYISPEQSLNSQTVDGRADLYSLGCTLYFMLVGKPPFAEGSVAQRIAAHQLAPPPDLEAKRPDCPEELIAVYERLMAKQPEDRFQTATDLLQAIDRLAPKVAASTGLQQQPAALPGASGILGPGALGPASASATTPAFAGDAMVDTSVSGGLSGGLGGGLSGGLSGDSLGSGVDLGALEAASGGLAPTAAKPKAPEGNKQSVGIVAAIALMVVAIAVMLISTIWMGDKPKPNMIKSTEGDGPQIILVPR